MSPEDRVHALVRSCREQFKYAEHPGLYRVAPLLRSVEGDFNIWCSQSGAADGPSVSHSRVIDNEVIREQIVGLLSELSALMSDCKRVADETDEDGVSSTRGTAPTNASGNQDSLYSNTPLVQSIPPTEEVEEDDTTFSLLEEEISYMMSIVTRLHRETQEHYDNTNLQTKNVVNDDDGIINFRRHLEHLIRTEASFTNTKSRNQDLPDTQAEFQKLTNIQTRLIDINVLRRRLFELQVGVGTTGTVSDDIMRPYSCFVENCHHPYETFATSEGLLSHMLERHSSMRWTCEYCEFQDRTGQESPQFRDSQGWEVHVQEQHPNLVSRTQGAIWGQLIGERVIGPQVCPFCNFRTTRAESEIDKHILQHIREFSLLAISEPSAALVQVNATEGSITGPGEKRPNMPSSRVVEKDNVKASVDATENHQATPLHLEVQGSADDANKDRSNLMPLVAHLEVPVASVRPVAVKTLGEGSNLQKDTLGAVAAQLEHEDQSVRDTAAETLGKRSMMSDDIPKVVAARLEPASPIVMDFRHLTEYFEGTVFADDYRTNLKVASERISALEACVSTNDQGDAKSGLLLTQAVYFSICGDFTSANGYLSELSRIARSTDDSSLLARCTAYEVYIRSTQNIPPFLRFRVDGDTGPAITRDIGLSALIARFLRKWSEKISQKLSPLEQFEVDVLRTYRGSLNELWLTAFPEHPQYFKDHSIVLFREDTSYWDELRQPEGGAHFPAIASYLDKLTLQYRLAGNAGNARSSLWSIYEDSLEKGDLIAAANCQLQLGDAIVSPPFTSPFALNLVSVVRDVGWTNDMWDKNEHKFALKQDPEAMQCYKQAYSLFEAGKSGRGVAAVLLRYACLTIADVILEPTQEDEKTDKDLVQLAYDHLKAAKELFEGDITNSLIVEGHLTICEIMRKDIPTALKLCFNIGDTGRCTGNTCTSEFIGMLYLRLARKLTLDEARAQDAVVLCACATVCFKGMNNPYLELHAAAASAKFYQRRRNIPLALKHIKNGRKLLELTETYFDSLEAQVESFRSLHENEEQTWLDHDLHMLKAKRALCTSNFGLLALEVDSSRQSTSSSSPNEFSHPIRASPMAAILQSFQFSGLDQSLLVGLQSLIAGSNSIVVLRRRYEDAIQRRRDELVIHADIDAAEKHLTDFLKDLEKVSIFSEELDTMKTVVFQYLGDFERARETITRILPTSFGGTRVAMPEIEGTDMQINDIMATEKRNKFDRAVSLCFAARDWERGISGVQDMLQRDSTRLDDMKSSTDPHIWYNMVHMACVLEQSGDIGLALEWYLSAFHVVETNLQQLAAINDRRKTRSTVSSRELFIGMARIAFRFSKASDSTCGPSQWNLTPAEWKDQGLRFLELGRSRTLLDLLIIQKLSPPDSKVWSKYSYQLRLKVKESSTNDTTESKSQDCIDKEPEIREKYLERIYGELMDGLESPSPSQLLPEPAAVRESNEKLYQCIPETAIVLHISSSREGLIILCITSQGIIDIYTAEITDLQLDRHIFRLAKLFRDVSSLPAIAICNQHLQAISDEIIVPVSQHIETKEHVIFIPSPSLNKFPLCALIYKKKPLFMSKDVSQLPSLSALQYTVEKKRYVSEKSSVVYKDPESTHGGAFDISTPVAIEMAASFRAKPEPATKTFTKDKFMEVYQQSDVLLIATHGDQSTKLAWESSILLHPPFQVLDLARLHSNATLNIVEACMSGLREESIVDELLGLSHAFLASGATTFLGGLREVSDKASALLMLFLAEEVKTSKRSKSLARCWRNAQMRLYDLNVEREVAILKDIKNYLGTSQAKLIDKELVAQFGQAVEDVIMGLQELGANSPRPFYWTPFVLMGHSGLVLDFEGVVEAISLGIVPGDEGDQAY